MTDWSLILGVACGIDDNIVGSLPSLRPLLVVLEVQMGQIHPVNRQQLHIKSLITNMMHWKKLQQK